MMKFKIIPETTKLPFLKSRFIAFGVSAALIVLSAVMFFGPGLTKGIDFEGGIMLEVGFPEAPDLGDMRAELGGLGLGQVSLQTFGAPDDILIRVQRQEGGSEAQNAAVEKVKAKLEELHSSDISYRRIEFVGPTVSGELVQTSFEAVLVSVFVILIYIWLRFEWHYSIGAIAALVHDVILTMGFFAITGIEFNVASVAAILTIVGYSINDTVVVYDRIRENFRRFKKMEVKDLLDLSINETLSRTVITSLTTLLALGALFIFGGEVIRGFAAAMIFGVVVGTYSSIFVAAPILLQIGLDHHNEEEDGFKPSDDLPETQS